MVDRLWKTKRIEGNFTGYTDQKGEKPGLQKKTEQEEEREGGRDGGWGEGREETESFAVLAIHPHPRGVSAPTEQMSRGCTGGGPSVGHTPSGPASPLPVSPLLSRLLWAVMSVPRAAFCSSCNGRGSSDGPFSSQRAAHSSRTPRSSCSGLTPPTCRPPPTVPAPASAHSTRSFPALQLLLAPVPQG